MHGHLERIHIYVKFYNQHGIFWHKNHKNGGDDDQFARNLFFWRKFS